MATVELVSGTDSSPDCIGRNDGMLFIGIEARVLEVSLGSGHSVRAGDSTDFYTCGLPSRTWLHGDILSSEHVIRTSWYLIIAIEMMLSWRLS